jgi:hypothetical protein
MSIVSEFNKAVKRLGNAELANTHANALKLAAFLHDRSLPATEDNFNRAFQELYRELSWVREPAKLRAEKENSGLARLKSTVAPNQEFVEKVRAGEAADAVKAADEASIKQCKSLIAAYLPLRNTTRGSSIDYSEQAKKQAQWTAELNNAIATKSNLQGFAASLVAVIEKAYRGGEAKSERL